MARTTWRTITDPMSTKPDYSRYKKGHFLLRTIDINEWEEERLGSGNNVTNDYSPIAKFEQEEGLARTPPRLPPMAPPLPPSKEPAPRKKRRKAKQPSHVGHVPQLQDERLLSSHKSIPPSKKRKRKRPTVHDRLVSLMKDLELKSGMLPHEVLRAVKQHYKDKYHNEPSQSAVTRAYDQHEAAPTTSTKAVN